MSDSLMFERGEPTPSDPRLGNVYGLAMPLLKQGCPVTPVQIENVGIAHYLDAFKILYLTVATDRSPLSGRAVNMAVAEWM